MKCIRSKTEWTFCEGVWTASVRRAVTEAWKQVEYFWSVIVYLPLPFELAFHQVSHSRHTSWMIKMIFHPLYSITVNYCVHFKQVYNLAKFFPFDSVRHLPCHSLIAHHPFHILNSCIPNCFKCTFSIPTPQSEMFIFLQLLNTKSISPQSQDQVHLYFSRSDFSPSDYFHYNFSHYFII